MKNIIRTFTLIALAVAAGILIDRSLVREAGTDNTSAADVKKTSVLGRSYGCRLPA